MCGASSSRRTWRPRSRGLAARSTRTYCCDMNAKFAMATGCSFVLLSSLLSGCAEDAGEDGVIAEIELGQEHVLTFLAHEGGSVGVEEVSPADQITVFEQLRGGTQPTALELYLAVTSDEDAPIELVRDHDRAVELLGRDSDEPLALDLKTPGAERITFRGEQTVPNAPTSICDNPGLAFVDAWENDLYPSNRRAEHTHNRNQTTLSGAVHSPSYSVTYGGCVSGLDVSFTSIRRSSGSSSLHRTKTVSNSYNYQWRPTFYGYYTTLFFAPQWDFIADIEEYNAGGKYHASFSTCDESASPDCPGYPAIFTF